jgi:hypothetical protein
MKIMPVSAAGFVTAAGIGVIPSPKFGGGAGDNPFAFFSVGMT